MAAAWILIAFISGALPFSYWLGRLALRADIRQYGDGNPGATNVLRSGGRGWAVLALLLDVLKGALPVGLAYFWAGLNGWLLAAVALAPVLGHAFSPFLHFQGGKAVAVTFGIWAGLTVWRGPSILGLSLALWFSLLAVDGWAVLFAMLTLLVYLVVVEVESILLVIWLGNVVILAWKHRRDLAHWPGFRSWLRNRMND